MNRENGKCPASLSSRQAAHFRPRTVSFLPKRFTVLGAPFRQVFALSSIAGPHDSYYDSMIAFGMSVTRTQFRRMALSFPETVESAHMNHPDFRVGGKIFVTLATSGKPLAMVKLTPEQQAEFIADEPAVFSPENGAWGRSGCTRVHLKAAKQAILRRAILAAWLNTAPKSLAKKFEASS
ncbi:MAG: MmcQ/YjbR family DNA-binding protein [Candidatus Acidiferrales bacterium]